VKKEKKIGSEDGELKGNDKNQSATGI